MKNIFRCLVLFLLALLAWGFVLGVNFVLMLSNFLSIKSAFELSGFELFPLKEDGLVGPFAGAFVGNATLAQLFAAGMALVLGMTIFVLCNRSFHVFHLVRDRQLYLAEKDEGSARAALWHIASDLILMGICLPLLLLAVRWDLDLFRFRSLAWAAGVDASQATDLAGWDTVLGDSGALFVTQLARVGAWGYLALTALAATCFDFSTRHVGDVWIRLFAAFEETWRGWTGAVGQDDSTIAPAAETSSGGDAALFELPETREIRSSAAPRKVEEAERLPVIGSDRRVSRAEALASSEYWIDPDNGEVWDAAYRRELLEPQAQAA